MTIKQDIKQLRHASWKSYRATHTDVTRPIARRDDCN
jgi:hypothetical protein